MAGGSSTSRGKVNTKTSRVILRSLKGTRPPIGGPSRLESTWPVREVKSGVPACPGKSVASRVPSDTKSPRLSAALSSRAGRQTSHMGSLGLSPGSSELTQASGQAADGH